MRYVVAITLIASLGVVVTPDLTRAAVIPGDLTVDGSLTFVQGFFFVDGTASTDTTLTLRQNGADTDVVWVNDSSAGSNPLSGALTHIDDGLGIEGEASAPSDFGEFATAVDLAINLMNSSATDTFEVVFGVTFNNLVHAEDATSPPSDAFADSEFTLDALGGEVFFTDIISDTMFGNEVGGVDTGDFGGIVSDSGTSSFSIVLAPGTSLDVLGEWTLDGGAFEDGDSASTFFDVFVEITEVNNLSAAIPEPSAIAIWGLGLVGLCGTALLRRRRRR